MTPTRTAEPTAPHQTGIAILGCGYWGVNYVRAFQELIDARTIVVCDERPDQLAAVKERFPHVAVTTDADEAMAMPDLEAVVIATPATTHNDLATRALLAGLHVLVEKPLTADAESAAGLVALAETLDRVLLVGHTFLYNPAIRTVKEYIDRDAVYYLYAQRTSLGPIRSDVNAVWDLAPHDVSIFNFLLDDEPEWVSAIGVRVLRNCREDVGFITLGYRDGVVGHIHVSWADPNKVRQVVVVTSERRVLFNDLDPLERVRVFDKGVKLAPADGSIGFGEHQLLLRDGDIISPSIPVLEPLRHQCGHFLHCIRRGDKPFTTASDGLAVVRVMEAIDRSIAQGGTRTAVEPEPERMAVPT